MNGIENRVLTLSKFIIVYHYQTSIVSVSMKVKPMAIDAIRIIDQNAEQQCQAVARRHLIWKLDRRLIPFLALLEMSSYINRSSIGM